MIISCSIHCLDLLAKLKIVSSYVNADLNDAWMIATFGAIIKHGFVANSFLLRLCMMPERRSYFL